MTTFAWRVVGAAVLDRRTYGQDVSPCGVMGALAGTITTASAVLRRNLFRP